MQNRKRLSDILHGERCEDLYQTWSQTDVAAEFAPLPGGTYEAHIASGEPFNSKQGTPGYRLSFKVCDGPHAGRMFWSELWLTPAALPMTKRDLLKIGIDTPDKMDRPLPQGIRCKCKVTLRRDDDGNEWNVLKRFDVIGIDKPEADPFAPTDDALAEADTSFDPAKLEAEGDGNATPGEPYNPEND